MEACLRQHRRQRRRLASHGPGDDGDGCDCRKPKPGLLLRGVWAPREGGAPFYLWTYHAGVGWRAGRLNFEAGYRGAVAERRVGTPNLTVMRWDGYYLSLLYGFP